jgi:hypothetical protein
MKPIATLTKALLAQNFTFQVPGEKLETLYLSAGIGGIPGVGSS